MRFESFTALLAVYAQSADALSVLSIRTGVSTSTVTATSFGTATSTITSVTEITSVATTCAVGSTAPIGNLQSSCSESVWSSSGNYWQQRCSVALVGGTTIRAYVYPNFQAAGQAMSICSALNNLHVPASSCAGINVMTIGALAQYFIVNGVVTLASANYASRAIQSYTTNPCEVTAIAAVTNLSTTFETAVVVYTSMSKVDYLETITLSIPDPTTSSTLRNSSSTSSPSVVMNPTSITSATTYTSVLTSTSSTLSFLPNSNMTSSSAATTSFSLSANASSTRTFPAVSNTTISSTQSAQHTSLNATTLTSVTIGVNASSTAALIVVPSTSSISNATLISNPSSNYTTIILSSSSPSSYIPTFVIPTLGATVSANIPASHSSSPVFQNTTRSSSTQISPITSSVPVVIPTSKVSPSIQEPSTFTSRLSTEALVTLTRFITDVYTVTACPATVENCPASQKTTFLSTKTIVQYSTVQTATPTIDTPISSVSRSGSGTAAHDGISKIQYTTSTLFSTSTQTITACPSSVKHCPASDKSVYFTDVFKAYTTVRPVSATGTSVSNIATHEVPPTSTLEMGVSTSGNSVENFHTTSTLYSTSVQTVTACPSNVKKCRALEEVVYTTDVVKVYTTVRPVAESSTEVVSFDTSTTVRSVTIASTTVPMGDTVLAHLGPENVPAVSSGSLDHSLKTAVDSGSASVLTVTGTLTQTAGGMTVTSTPGFLSAASSPASVTTKEAFIASSGTGSSPDVQPLTSSFSSAVAVASSEGSLSRPSMTTGVMPDSSSILPLQKSSSTSADSVSPSLALHIGSACTSKPRMMPGILGAVCIAMSFALNI